MIGENDTRKLLEEFANAVNQAAQRTLGSRKIGKNRNYGEASGALRKSLTFKVKDKTIQFGSPLPYAAFVHWGVNGTAKNHGAPFSYGSKQPPSSAIMKWMKVKPIRLRDKDGKFIKQTESRMKSAAFLIARSIKRNGIKGLKYYEIAYKSIFPKYTKRLTEALQNDINDDLQDEID